MLGHDRPDGCDYYDQGGQRQADGASRGARGRAKHRQPLVPVDPLGPDRVGPGRVGRGPLRPGGPGRVPASAAHACLALRFYLGIRCRGVASSAITSVTMFMNT